MSDKLKYKLKKILKVVLWTALPYLLIKIPQELLGLPEFAELSWLLNLSIYVGTMLRKQPTNSEIKKEVG